jgi:hypothetical protein
VHAQSPTDAKAAAGRVEGGSDVLLLGTSATGTIAVIAGFNDVAVVGQAIEQRGGHLGV